MNEKRPVPSEAEAAAFMQRAAEEFDVYGDLIDFCTQTSLEENRPTRLTSEPQNFIRPGTRTELAHQKDIADGPESPDNKGNEVSSD